MSVWRIHSSNFNSYAILALTIFLSHFALSSSKQGLSDENINTEIQNLVNDGFTLTREDKEYFDNIVENAENADDFDGDLRIVSGEDTQLGKT